MAYSSLVELPTEILEAIFLNLDPNSLISVSQTNKLIKQLTLTAPIIWRHFCLSQFTTWDARHDIATKVAGPLSDVDWRALYIKRVQIERSTRRLLDEVVSTQHRRIQCINAIAEHGYDAKETLLKEFACPDDAEDVLARRYYANAVLEHIHREIAIKTWKDLADGLPMPLERVLGAYDMFARVGEDVDLDIIGQDLDRLAAGVLGEHPDFHRLSSRMKASNLASYLREQGFQGAPDTSYRALRNTFIGLVLRSAPHESLPLISVAIYCALAHRVGLDARPCGFKYHVYTLVYAPSDYDLDGKYKPSSSSELDYMYLDPFRSDMEVGQGDLRHLLREMGVPREEYRDCLGDASTKDMVLRTARNIMTSVQAIRQTEATLVGVQTSWLNAYPDMDNAFYSTIWAMLLLSPSDNSPKPAGSTLRRRQYLPYLLEHFQTHFPWDVSLIEKYVMPMFANAPEGERLWLFAQSMYHMDGTKKSVLRRDNNSTHVRFKVGQLFQHVCYNYEGVITGWDNNCDAGEDWIQNMRVDALPGGRNQAFYHVM
jgi:F-box protein 21